MNYQEKLPPKTTYYIPTFYTKIDVNVYFMYFIQHDCPC